MREIKFKLFGKHNKKMYIFDPRWGNFGQGGGWVGGVPLNEFEKNGRTFAPSNQEQLEPESCEWLQFTGLLDKNDIEIYEGDIVHIASSPQENNKVEYCNGIYLLLPHGLYLSDWYEHVGIIGNTYENPELLEKPE